MIDKKIIKKNIPNTIAKIDFKGLGKRQSGKVRDWYSINHLRILIATDRISAFDKVLGTIPFRGAVLNLLSHFWFEQTRDIIQNHMIGVVDPNIMLVAECDPLDIEVVVRGYITGVTDTSLWKHYERGQRTIYGIKFPEGLKKNQKLKTAVITPTTRATGKGGHDEPITKKEIIQHKLVSSAIWRQIEKTVFKLYERGTKIADRAGLILADTKYEFGLDKRGKLILIDEIHTPDSSRYWLKKTYREKFRNDEEVDNADKEIMRLWFTKQGYAGKGKAPQMTDDLIVKISLKYQEVYEKLTGEKFTIDLSKSPIERINESLTKLL